jgi:hypothetical protein
MMDRADDRSAMRPAIPAIKRQITSRVTFATTRVKHAISAASVAPSLGSSHATVARETHTRAYARVCACLNTRLDEGTH